MLLVGVGRFGEQHLIELLHLAEEGEVTLAGAVTASAKTAEAIAQRYGIPTFAGLTEDLLKQVDCVDIATPAATHPELIRKCLPFAHVLVEKPLAPTPQDALELSDLAASLDRILMTGHIYRHHPAVQKVKEIVQQHADRPTAFEGTMVNPGDEYHEPVDINLEFLHFFDIIDYLFEVEPDIHWATRRGNVNEISLQYPGQLMATLKIGWQGRTRVRKFRIFYSDWLLECNLIENLITISRRNHQFDKMILGSEPKALRTQLQTFLQMVSKNERVDSLGDIAARIIGIAVKSTPIPIGRERRPRIAIVGAGIFGATCAQELSEFADITLFERHPEVLQEVSFANQWRHHSGFHYPRSYDTIMEIHAARDDFEAVYGEAVRHEYPSYFCPSRWGIEIPAERYLAACQSNRLNFSIEAPPAEAIDLDQVSICVKSDEGVYDYYKLKAMVEERLEANPRIEVRMGTAVLDASIAEDGSKRVLYENADGKAEESFDYLVNTTYSGLNLVAKWFGFPIEPLRFDLYELVVLDVPIEQVCITIIDGPFTSLMGMGEKHRFLLSHIKQSVLKSVITEDGLPPDWGVYQSNAENMVRDASRYIPALKKSTIIRSVYATRAVNAFSRDFDARPTVIRSHGFGCWSVLGGKIITCVSNAREIAQQIQEGER